MIYKFRKPLWAVLFAVYMLALSGAPAIAGMIGSVASEPLIDKEIRQQEISAIQRALENEMVKAKLEAYGLTQDEIQTKLQGLSDEQIHLLAQASDNILAGGDDGLGVVIAVLVIILLIVLIIHLTGHHVVVR